MNSSCPLKIRRYLSDPIARRITTGQQRIEFSKRWVSKYCPVSEEPVPLSIQILESTSDVDPTDSKRILELTVLYCVSCIYQQLIVRTVPVCNFPPVSTPEHLRKVGEADDQRSDIPPQLRQTGLDYMREG